MTIKSSPQTYGAVAISLHWLSALLILALLWSGFRAAGLHDPAAKAALLRLHLPAGLLVLALTAARILWWLGFDAKPAALAASPLQQRAASFVHILLYVVMLGMVASGLGMTISTGAAGHIFSPDTSALPDFWRVRPRIPHGLGARLLLALLGLHVAAALYHQFVRGDAVFRRIWFAR
ncbi:cytochrome b561 [Rhodoblastus acidophilus]|uniref:cytochrome b n=1 Tax=Rhodoblastus acidophilus TaxID=1074 RepID=UPI00222551B9|nr:cytochrome b/b6 domain-containing protein [Rhodoblastus acidophilus]MCW2284061.1 cytochrome b561 [Rhodoblastus acidophilus]MCW2332757.1 cytochrome b561 [Rhodoblastus acidophilus]